MKLNRRLLLRGAAGLGIALPLAVGRSDRALYAGGFPKRLVVVFSANGTMQDVWAPPRDALQPAGGAPDLGPILAPLAPFWDQLLVLAGIDMESSYHGPGDGSHWNGMGHMLTGTELVETSPGEYWGGGISVDQLVAQRIGKDTALGSLELCVQDAIGHVASRMSYLGPAQPLPPEPDPRRAFARMFGPLPAAERQKRGMVLDAVRHDLAELSARLGKDDRERLQVHAHAVDDLAARLAIEPHCAAKAVDPATDPSDMAAYPALGRLQMDLMVAALACDLTRVASLQFSTSGSTIVHTWLGQDVDHHSISHLPKGDPSAHRRIVDINRFYAEQLAYLLAAMSAVPEGDGTLLDHCLVLWCNELGDGEKHTRRNMPYLLAGRARGALKTGRVLRFGGAAAGHVHNNLLVSLCHALEVPVATFGNPAYCTGPLAGLGTG